MTTHASWLPLRPYLDGDRFTFLFADHRGYGLSRGLTPCGSVEEVVKDVLTLADDHGAERFHVVGHSMGGMVAQRLMVDAPGRLRSATLVTPVPASGLPLDAQGAELFRAVPRDDLAWATVTTMLTGDRLGPAFADAHRSPFRATVDPQAMLAFLSLWTGRGFADRMPGRTTPTLVLTGIHDIEPLRRGALEDRLGPWLEQVEFETLDTGHFPMLEAPPRFAALLQRFLGR